uniref:PHD-type domain-containing protein n=1 Tax=Panagrellus redivivus TaxID=6233 RepID=A0A7E4WCX7_PANRE
NKEKRRLERKAAAELKKMSKRPPKHPTDEIDMNACHCMCRKPFDVKKFYLACNKCFRWFHGRCVGLTEKRASRMATWECPECNPNFVVKQPSRRPATSRAKSASNDVNADFDDEEEVYE